MSNKLDLSRKHEKYICDAALEADKSPCFHRHGCIIVGNGKVLGKGFNNYRNTSTDKMLTNCYTCHAEISAIRDVLRNQKVVQHYSKGSL